MHLSQQQQQHLCQLGSYLVWYRSGHRSRLVCERHGDQAKKYEVPFDTTEEAGDQKKEKKTPEAKHAHLTIVGGFTILLVVYSNHSSSSSDDKAVFFTVWWQILQLLPSTQENDLET